MEKPSDNTSASGESSSGSQSSADAKSQRKRRRQRQETWGALERREAKLNSISSVDPSMERRRPQADEPKPQDAPKSSGAKRDHHASVAKEISSRYVRLGDHYYFPDTSDKAFKVTATRTTTRLDTPEVIRDVLRIENDRRANDTPLRIEGSSKFLAEAWKQAQMLGIEVRGYRPSALERAQVVRALGEHQPAEPEVTPSPSPSLVKDIEAGRAPAAAGAATPRERPVDPEDRRIRGRLLAHGEAPYQHDHRNEMSYYVRLKTAEGEKTVWGADFKRALKDSLSKVKNNDLVVLHHAGEDPVTVTVRRTGNDGQVQEKKEVSTYRHRWIVETAEFLKDREKMARVLLDPDITPKEGTARYPQLAGTYHEIRVAELVAEKEYLVKEDGKRFVQRIKTEVAKEIALGHQMPTGRLRKDWATDREPRNREQEREQSQERVLG